MVEFLTVGRIDSTFFGQMYSIVCPKRVNLSTVDVTFPDVKQFSLKARQGDCFYGDQTLRPTDWSSYITFLIT